MHLPSTVMSWMANLKIMVQIIPSVIFTLPSTISEGKNKTKNNALRNQINTKKTKQKTA